MLNQSAEQLTAGQEIKGKSFDVEEIISELAGKKDEQLDYAEMDAFFPKGEPVDANDVVDYFELLSQYIAEHNKIGAERNIAVQLKLALADRVFINVQNLPRLADGMGGKKEAADEASLRDFIASFSSRYEEYVKEELRGKWRHCGDGSKLFSAILRAYMANLEVAIISADTYILSSRLRESVKEAEEGFKEEIQKEIKKLETAKPGEKESEKLRKECGHTALRIYLNEEKYIVDPTQKQFNSTLDVFSVYKESDLIDTNGIIRIPKKEKARLKSGELTGADILLLLKNEEILT